MKKLTIIIIILSATIFNSCTERDKNGNTDANNTTTTKNYTDSTRGVLGDSTVTDTSGNPR